MQILAVRANYVATLAYRVTKLKRAQLGIGITRKGAKFGQNRSTLSTSYDSFKLDRQTDSLLPIRVTWLPGDPTDKRQT